MVHAIDPPSTIPLASDADPRELSGVLPVVSRKRVFPVTSGCPGGTKRIGLPSGTHGFRQNLARHFVKARSGRGGWLESSPNPIAQVHDAFAFP